ncbi:MAG: Dabb family protein [Bryobacterales bacterium]|nr:Dabb family protein [Bryobacterales bacterium]
MEIHVSLKKAILSAGVLLLAGAGAGYAANKYGKPKSIIHVVTLYYQDGVTDAQKKTVTDGVEKMAAEIPGVRNIWLKGIKVQGSAQEKQADGTMKTRQFTDAFVMEFENEAAFKGYDDHPAHRAWEKIYVPLRGQSRTHDITNP